MKRLLFLAVASGGLWLGANGAPPPATPAPSPASLQPPTAPDPYIPPPEQENRPVRPAFAMDNQLIQTGAFEMPRVKGRVSKEAKEGNFVKFAQGEWVGFRSNEAARKGGLEAGLTDEIARTGRQSVYVKFEHVKAPLAAVELVSDLLPVKPGKPYRTGIWGRIDRKNPLTLDQRTPVLRLQVDFFREDKKGQVAETVFRVQPIPGTANRPLFFTSERWTEYHATLLAPSEAAYIRVSWTWSTTPEPGETNGVAYFDDATVEGELVNPPPGDGSAPGVSEAVPVVPAPK